MKVRELIDILNQLDPDLPVMVRAYESNLNEITNVNQIRVIDQWKDEHPYNNESYNGQYKNIDHVAADPNDPYIQEYIDQDVKEAAKNNYPVLNAVYFWSTCDGQYLQ